jgi:hypothetical protein
VLEVAAHVGAALDEHVPAQQDRGHQPAAQRRVAVDLLGDQRAEDERALRVADQDEATAVAVPAHIVPERRQHVPVRKCQSGG